MADRIQQRRDTAARWAQYNPILLEGEVGYVTDDPNQYKIGDGVHTWNELPLRGFDGTLVHELGTSETAAMSQKGVTDVSNALGLNYYNVFANNQIYNVGNIVRYGNKLYRFISKHSAGEWNQEEVVEVNTVSAQNYLFSDNDVLNRFIKEIYTTHEFSSNTVKVQISRSVLYEGYYNTIFRMYDGDTTIVFYNVSAIYTNQDDAEEAVQAFSKYNGNYCVVDWDTIPVGFNRQYDSINIYDIKRINDLSRSPFIKAYIAQEKADNNEQEISNTKEYATNIVHIPVIKDTLREAIKELCFINYTISENDNLQISKAAPYNGNYNTIIRILNSDGRSEVIHFSSHTTQEEALSVLKSFYSSEKGYCIIDWDKITDGTDNFFLITEETVNTKIITNIEFNPYSGAFDLFSDLHSNLYKTSIETTLTGYYNSTSGSLVADSNGHRSALIPIGKYNHLRINTMIGANGLAVIFFDRYKGILLDISIPGTGTGKVQLEDIDLTQSKYADAMYVAVGYWGDHADIFWAYLYVKNAISDIEDNQKVLSNNDLFNSFVKEIYTSEDLSDVTDLQISRSATYETNYNTFLRFKKSNGSWIYFINQSSTSIDDAEEKLTAFNIRKENYCVVDWSKIPIGYNGYINGFSVNAQYINNLEFNPYIASYIEDNAKTDNGYNPIIKNNDEAGISIFQKPITDYIHFIIYGQSLSTGQQTCPQLSRENFRGNLMVGDNEWIYGTGSNIRSAFNPLKAVSTKGIDYVPTGNSDQTNGETPNVNFANAAKSLLDGYLLNVVDRKIIASSCGTGGKSIELLSKDCPNNSGALFNNFVSTLNTTKSLADDAGKTLCCAAIIWMQGEWNASSTEDQGWTSGTYSTDNKDDYKAYLIGGTTSDDVSHNGLINDMVNQVLSIYEQEEAPIILCSQIGPNFNKSFDNPIDMALLEANNELDNFVLVAPSYCVTDRANHLDPNGTRWLGEYYAKVWYNRVILGNKWKPLQPNKITKGENYLTIRFDVPVPPLKFDTELVRSKNNYGFSVKDAGSTKTISSVEIIGDNEVKITCSSNFIGDVEIAYATQSVVYGNLRDSDTWNSFEVYKDLDTVVSNPDGVSYHPTFEPEINGNVIYNKKYPCYNWCLRFYYKINSNTAELVIDTK